MGNPYLHGGYKEYYIRDAQGNIMAIYRYTNNGPASLQVTERPLYGSKRLGSYAEAQQLLPATAVPANYAHPMLAARTQYELADHLGNVRATVSGQLLPSANPASAFEPHLLSETAYEPFGSLLPGRNYSSDSYRFGFQGQEKDNELFGFEGTALSFTYRVHDARVGRFLSIDPLAAKYPHYTPYSFSGNRVIDAIELEGLEELIIHRHHRNDGSVHIKVFSYGQAEYESMKGAMFMMAGCAPDDQWKSNKKAYTLGIDAASDKTGFNGMYRGTLTIDSYQNGSNPSYEYDATDLGIAKAHERQRTQTELSGFKDVVIGGVGIAGSILTESGTGGFGTAIAYAIYWTSADQLMGGLNKMQHPEQYADKESMPIKALVGQFTGRNGETIYDVINLAGGVKGMVGNGNTLEKIIGAYDTFEDASDFVKQKANEAQQR